MLAFFVSPGAMRCHVATSCHVLWLLVLIPGCWGRFNSFFPHSQHGRGCSRTLEIPPGCVTGYTLPSLGVCRTHRLKIPIPRAWGTGGSGRSLRNT